MTDDTTRIPGGAEHKGDRMATTPTLHPHLVEAFSLEGRTAVITGAAGGIGRQAAITFAEAGANIVATDRDESSLADTMAALDGLGGKATAIAADVASKPAMDDLAARAMELHGRLDIWANVAGILHYSPIVEMQEADLRRIIDINLLGVYWGSAAAARAMQPAGRGSIINIASAAGDMAAPSASGYGLTKAAVIHFTKTLAMELGPDGIRANAVAPGWIETPMTVGPNRVSNDEEHQKVLRQRARISPLGLTGVARDISLAMLYLAADASRFVTGQVVRPNGGIVMP
jgi:3-oxoacyl-[acyl-carrier protein] reductase